MAMRADFTEDEWATLRRAPMVAGMAITLADPGGPIEVFKETAAVLRVVTEAAEQRQDLIGEVARDLRDVAQKRQNPVGDFKPRGATAAKEILDELSRAVAIVEQKAGPEEASAFREWLMESAQRASEAAKEGGFMGFGAEQVSQGEKRMLSEVATAVGVGA
jgi:hypothetical protein